MLLAQKASQAFIAALLIWLSSKLPATMACRRCSALAPGRACSGSAPPAQLAGDVAHRRFQQTVLILEIVTDDAGRYARPSGNLRDGGIVHSHFIYRVQGGVNQLPLPYRLHPQFGHFLVPFISFVYLLKRFLIGRSI
jgi:hypothetical protein